MSIEENKALTLRWVEIEDHGSTLQALNDWLQIDSQRTAIVTIDMHRGHLDPSEATMPVSVEESERVCRHAKDILTFGREHHIPIIHIILVWRPVEVNRINPRLTATRMVMSKAAPITDAQKRGVPHNIEGSIQTQLMPEIGPEKGDYVINTKRTLSIFMGTDLDHLLRILKIDTLVLIGINTNTCVQCAAFESMNRGFKTVVISNCVASMYGQDLHILGLQNIARCLGWVLTVEEFKEKVLAYSQQVAK